MLLTWMTVMMTAAHVRSCVLEGRRSLHGVCNPHGVGPASDANAPMLKLRGPPAKRQLRIP